MERITTILLGIGLLAMSTVVLADDEASAVSYVKAAPYGRCYFKMEADPSAPYKWESPGHRGAAYQVQRGEDKLLWEVSGWHAKQVYLSNRCELMVRIGNWPRGRGPSKDHLGLAFYERGKELRRYSTADLVRDAAKVPTSVSHYQVIAEAHGFDENKRFSLTTTDGFRWIFNDRGDALSVQPEATSAPSASAGAAAPPPAPTSAPSAAPSVRSSVRTGCSCDVGSPGARLPLLALLLPMALLLRRRRC